VTQEHIPIYQKQENYATATAYLLCKLMLRKMIKDARGQVLNRRLFRRTQRQCGIKATLPTSY